jgi:hypothetical protein
MGRQKKERDPQPSLETEGINDSCGIPKHSQKAICLHVYLSIQEVKKLEFDSDEI